MSAGLVYRIESRSTPHSRWRVVTPVPHGERYPFDAQGLYFPTWERAEQALAELKRANGAEVRIFHSWPRRGVSK